jgi:hypothetical protein
MHENANERVVRTVDAKVDEFGAPRIRKAEIGTGTCRQRHRNIWNCEWRIAIERCQRHMFVNQYFTNSSVPLNDVLPLVPVWL